MPNESVQIGNYEVLQPIDILYNDPNPEKPHIEGTLPIGTTITVTSTINPNLLNAQGQPVGPLPLSGKAQAVFNGSTIHFELFPGHINNQKVRKLPSAGGRRKSNHSRRNRRRHHNRRKSRHLRR